MPSVMLLGYGLEQPSYRHRMRSLIEPLQAAGWQVRAEQFPSGRYGLRTWERRAFLRWADVTVLHQIKLSSIEARLFAAFSRRRVFDVDDAIYVRKPRRLGDLPDESAWRKQKFAATCRWVDAVAAGNDVLAGVARAAAREIVVLPTSIDTACYETYIRGTRRTSDDRLDRQSRKSDLPGYDSPGFGASEQAPPDPKDARDLLRISGLE